MGTNPASAAACQDYVTDGAPVVSLQLDRDLRIIELNAHAARVLGPDIVGRCIGDLLVPAGSVDVAGLAALGVSRFRLTFATGANLPDTFDVYLAPVGDGTLLLASLDAEEQTRLQREILRLNAELVTRTRDLQQANADLLSLSEELEQRVTARTAELVEANRQLDWAAKAALGLRDQLAQSQRMEAVGRLAGGVAHDFNNMLSVILGRLDMALARVSDDDPLRTELQETQAAAERSSDVVRQLLAFSRRTAVTPQVIDLNDAIDKTIKLLRRLIGENIEMEWTPGRTASLVLLDPTQLTQVLTNLCVNARDAIEGHGRITIATDLTELDPAYCAAHGSVEPGTYVTLTVADNGKGIAPDIIEHIFEPFYTTKEAGRGTGLGLATVQGIVAQCRGTIDVTSSPDCGTAFRICLPLQRPADEERSQAVESREIPRGTETVLLVEDEAAILRLVRMMLEQQGYTVLAAAGPHEAIRKAETFTGRIDLLLTDVVMPDMNGLDVANRLRAALPGLKVLLMSGYTASALAPDGVVSDEFEFVQKPFTLTAIATAVRRALDRA